MSEQPSTEITTREVEVDRIQPSGIKPPTKKCSDTGSSPESGIDSKSNSSEHSNSINVSDEGDDGADERDAEGDGGDEEEPDDNNDEMAENSSNGQSDEDETGQMATKRPKRSVTWSDNDDGQVNQQTPECSNKNTELPRKSLLKQNPKRINRHIRFACVREYLFNRKQSFCTLPSTGGCALGMDSSHHDQATIPLPVHRERLHSKRRKKLRHWRRKQRRASINGPCEGLTQEVSDEITTSSDSDSDAPEEDLSGVDDWWFLQPIAPKKRRKILKKFANEVDSQDRQNNRVLRSDREVCGCSCIGVCHPDTCECSGAGIPCQVDRDGFPCGCQVGRCGNSSGRRSFNSARVRHHFFKTMYRLRCQEQGTVTPETSVTPPTQPPEVPIDEPQQPFSFGDFTRPSDFQGTIYWPQQWDHQSPGSQWSGIPQTGVAEDSSPSRLCENVPQVDEQAVLQAASVEQSSESSTEDNSSIDLPPGGAPEESRNSDQTFLQPLSEFPIEHEVAITVVNEDSRDSQESDSVSI